MTAQAEPVCRISRYRRGRTVTPGWAALTWRQLMMPTAEMQARRRSGLARPSWTWRPDKDVDFERRHKETCCSNSERRREPGRETLSGNAAGEALCHDVTSTSTERL